MPAQKFRKRPVVIDAIQWDGSEMSQAEIVNWSGGKITGQFDGDYYLSVRTLESHNSDLWADVGDWIIKGIAGEFYPCRDDIFQATYELVKNVDVNGVECRGPLDSHGR